MNLKIVLSLLAIGGWTTSAQAATNVLQLTPALLNLHAEELRTNAPALRAADHRVEAARAGTEAVRVWDDPEVSLGTMLAPGRMRRDDGDLIYGVSQKLPLFGRPAAAREAASAEARSAETRADYQFQLLRLELVRRFLAAAEADHDASLTGEDLDWLDSLVATAEERFKAGQGNSTDTLRLRNERDLVLSRLATQEQLALQARRELNRVLNREPGSPWPTLRLPDPGPEVRFNEGLRKLALRNEARLKVLRREADVAVAQVDVARRTAKPEVRVFGELRQHLGSGDVREGMVGVGLTVPWFNRGRYRAEVARASGEADAARFDVADYERFVPVEAERVATLADNARREALALRDQVLPRTEEIIELQRRAWTAGEEDLSRVLETRRQWIENRRLLVAAVAEQWRMLAELTLCCGLADLEALEMLPAGGKEQNP